MKQLVVAFLWPVLVCCQFSETAIVRTESTLRQQVVVQDTVWFDQLPLVSARAVIEFYRSRDHQLFWFEDGRRTAAGDSLFSIVREVELWGLIGDDYHRAALQLLDGDTVPESVMRMDVLLSDAYFSLYRHLTEGRLDPVTLARRDISNASADDAIGILQQIHAHRLRSELQAREPGAAQYLLLKEALKSLGHSSSADSGADERKNKIILNMERWRWEKSWPDRYILVNIPAFSLYAVDRDSIWLMSAVIVGKRKTPTPVMESVIRSFTIYPYWHVPGSIATREMLPVLQKDPSYLKRRNFQVLDRRGALLDSDTIRWKHYTPEHFPFILRQREGSENTMGIIKFNFFNPYNVYLHDTNAPRLFREARRDVSHGCVRVEKAVALAHHLVRDDDIYVSPEDLDQYLSLQQRLNVDLRKPIPVKLKYFTADVHGGVVRFYDDIYGKDSVMMQALYGNAAVGPGASF